MVKRKVLLVGVVVLLLASVSFAILNVGPEDELKFSYPMYLTIGSVVGVNIDTDAVWFGVIAPNGTSSRFLNISSSEKNLVSIKLSGELAEWVTVSDNNFAIDANETKSITVVASAPMDAKYGDYEGKLAVYFRKV
jgi:hypothetical protein